MKRLQFSFTTKLTFNDDVHSHSFALRVIPPETPTQHILSCSLELSPHTSTKLTRDAFGNNVSSGYIAGAHRFLDFSIQGTAELNLEAVKTDFMPCYRYPSAFTKPDAALRAFYEELKGGCEDTDAAARAAYFSDRLSDTIAYQRGATSTTTTAAEAFACRAGVCQDFSHLLISLLRLDGIPARYMAGLAFCDGETHAWVEFWNGEHWIGIDPANNCPVTEDYLVLSQGRDFGDCAIDRGIMLGSYTQQLQLVRSFLQEAYV